MGKQTYKMKTLRQSAVLLILLSVLLSACSPLVRVADGAGSPTLEPAPGTSIREAQVQSVKIQVIDSNPPLVSAAVHGSLTESCATLGQSQVQYADNTFHVTVYVVSPSDRGCAPSNTPFDTTIALDTSDLPAGNYTVVVNGVSTVFRLQYGSQPAPTSAPTSGSNGGGGACTDAAAFVMDVSIPDNQQVAPLTPFTKIWRLKNTGTCTWNSDYAAWYITGTTMTQSPAYKIMGSKERVVPGQTVDVSIGMTAPPTNGTYTSYWGIKGSNGQFMPIQGGSNGNSFYVKIKVNDGSVETPGKVTGGSITIDFEQGSGSPCTADATYLIHVSITANGPTTVYYELDSATGHGFAGWYVDPDNGAHYTIAEGKYEFTPEMFAQGGPQTIVVPMRFVGPYDEPNNITVNARLNSELSYSAKLNCP